MDNREEYMSSWYDMLKEAMEEHGDDFDRRICTISEEELKRKFRYYFEGSDFNDPEKNDDEDHGATFVSWSDNWVYVSYGYDGSPYILSIPRNPDNKVVRDK